MNKLTEKEAFLAMYSFLASEYELTGSDDIAGLLGGLSLLEDGSTADPAAWENWIQAIHKVTNNSVDALLRIDNGKNHE